MAKVYLAVYSFSDGSGASYGKCYLSAHKSEEGAYLTIEDRHKKTMDDIFKDQLAYPVNDYSDFEIETMELED